MANGDTELVLDEFVNSALADGGSKLGSSIEFGALTVRSAQSYAVSLSSIIERAGKSTLESNVLTIADAWLIHHNFSVAPAGRTSGPVMVGFEVEFDRPSQIVVTEIFPEKRFVERASVRGEWQARAGIGLNGEALPIPVAPTAAASANVVAKTSFAVRTPEIVTSGRFSNRTEWLFYKTEQPLLGDFRVAHLVLAPKGATEAGYLCRVRAAVPGNIPGWPAALVPSEWARASVELGDTELSRLASVQIALTP